MKVRWLKEGTRLLRRVHARIREENPAAALMVVDRIEQLVKRLATFPESGRVGHVPRTRELVVPGLPYLVVYRLTPDAVEILRVFHTARNWPELME